MSANLIEDVNAAASTARAELVRTVRNNDRRAKRLIENTLRSARKTKASTAIQARRALASATGQVEHRYLDLKSTLRERPNAALATGAAIILGLGLLLWIGYRIEREPSTS